MLRFAKRIWVLLVIVLVVVIAAFVRGPVPRILRPHGADQAGCGPGQ